MIKLLISGSCSRRKVNLAEILKLKKFKYFRFINNFKKQLVFAANLTKILLRKYN